MAIDYRQLQAPSVLDTSVPDNGGAQAAQSLARAFKDFSDTSLDATSAIRSDQGQREGAAAGGSGDPQFRQGLQKFTAYGQAYNNAALRSYAIESEAHADDLASRLQVESANNPQTFATTYAAARDAAIKAAPVEAQNTLRDMYNTRLATGVQNVSRAQAVEINQKQKQDLQEGIARQTDRVANLSANGDFNGADEERVRLRMLIDGARNTNTISPAEAAALSVNADRSITTQTVQAQFDRVLQDPHGDPVQFLSDFDNLTADHPEIPPEEKHKITGYLYGQLRQHNELIALDKNKEREEERLRFEAGNQQATVMLLKGTLTVNTLAKMTAAGQLDANRALTLDDALKSRRDAPEKSDPRTLFAVKTNLLSYERNDIAATPGLSWTDKATLTEEYDKRSSTWEGLQSVKEGRAMIDRQLHILPGTPVAGMTEEKLTQRQRAQTELYNRLNALPPDQRESQAISVAQQVINTQIVSNTANKLASLQSAYASFKKQYGTLDKRNGLTVDEYKRKENTLTQAIAKAQQAVEQDQQMGAK